PRETHRCRAIVAMLANRRAKSSVKNNAQNPGWNRASRCNRLRHRRRRLRPRLVLATLALAGTKTWPTWLSALKQRSANPQARHARPAVKHAHRRRPSRHRAAIRYRLRRRGLRAPATNDRQRPRPISPTKARRPSTIPSNKRWQIYWGGRRPEVG